MKKIIPSACVLVLLAGCAEWGEEQHVTTVTRYPSVYHGRVVTYGINRRTSMGQEPVEITNTDQALAARSLVLQRPQEQTAVEGRTISVVRMPQAPYSGSVSSVPSSTSPVLTSPEPLSPPARPSTPQPVAEPPRSAPMAVPVPGKPGYVLSPFSPKSGYVDVTGMPPGTEAKDPYTGRVFRVP